MISSAVPHQASPHCIFLSRDRNFHEYSADIRVPAPAALRHGVEIDFTVARES